MRLAQLYLRSRSTCIAVMCLLGIAASAWACSGLYLQPRSMSGGQSLLVPAMLLAPLASSVVIGVSTYSPFGEMERACSCRLYVLRLGHLLCLVLVSMSALAIAARPWEQQFAELVLWRNLAGFTGLALLGAWTLGSHLSWIVPLAYGLLSFLTGQVQRGSDVEWAGWAWPMRLTSDGPSVLITIALLIVGLGAASLFGARGVLGRIGGSE